MNELSLTERMAHILRNGPDRVVVDAEGLAVPSFRARRDYGITPDIIFIRDDGWSLGAPERFEAAAHREWKDEWVGFVRRGDTQARPMSEYGGPD